MIEPFISAAWLERNRDQVVVADVRWYLDGRPGADAYEVGHIPGAVFVELGDVLSSPASEQAGRHPLPTAVHFANSLAALGVADADTVVAYDDAGGLIAGRLVWLLRAIGVSAAVLDGGLAAWPGVLEAGSVKRPGASFAPRSWPAERIAEIEDLVTEVQRGAGLSAVVMIDARDHARFGGGPDPVDPRSGHIPGALSVPAAGNLGSDGRMLSAAVLRDRFAAAGITSGAQVISYCGSGVTACHNLLALERAGLGQGRLYPGSWSQWSRNPTLPVETGTAASS